MGILTLTLALNESWVKKVSELEPKLSCLSLKLHTRIQCEIDYLLEIQ